MDKVYNFLSFCGLAVILVPSAHAYIDPGTGALVVQAAIGAAATALVTIKYWWSKLVSVFRALFASR